MIRLARPTVGREELAEITSVIESGFLTNGPKVTEFENLLAGYLGTKNAIAVSSGTAALHLALSALGIGEGDEVIVPDFSFPAVANSVVLTGGNPVFCDIDLATFNLDPFQVKDLITDRTRVILPVHQFGLSAHMEPILDIANESGLVVVEDAACALGAEYQGRKCGTFGRVACFSFHPRKIITTGEGGLVVTNDDAIADKVRSLKNHGAEEGNFSSPGYNYRMSDLSAAVGIAQMRKLGTLIARRRELALAYSRYLAGVAGLTLPHEPVGYKHTYQSFVVKLDERHDRTRILSGLKREGIEAGIGTYAIHKLGYYHGKQKVREGRLRRSAWAFQQSLTLPLYSEMTDSNVQRVSGVLKSSLVETG